MVSGEPLNRIDVRERLIHLRTIGDIFDFYFSFGSVLNRSFTHALKHTHTHVVNTLFPSRVNVEKH